MSAKITVVVWAVDENDGTAELISVKARVGKKVVRLSERIAAFHYRVVVPTSEVSLTPKRAVDRWKQQKLDRIESLRTEARELEAEATIKYNQLLMQLGSLKPEHDK